MAFITANELRTTAATTPTTADLDSKYVAAKNILSSQAQEGFYTADVVVGSKDLAEFKTWIAGYGFRVIANSDQTIDASPVRIPTVGTRTVVTVSWQEFSVQASPQVATEGSTITYSILTKGVADGTTLYWNTTGTAQAADFEDSTLQGTVTINNSAGTVVRNVRVDALGEGLETVIFNLYWDTLRTDLVARNSQVSITANAT